MTLTDEQARQAESFQERLGSRLVRRGLSAEHVAIVFDELAHIVEVMTPEARAHVVRGAEAMLVDEGERMSDRGPPGGWETPRQKKSKRAKSRS